MSITLRITTLFLGFLLPTMGAFAQSDTLQVRYDELLDRSETYNQFKVIRTERLQSLWSEVQDSIRTYQQGATVAAQEISELKSQVAELTSDLQAVRVELGQTQDQLGMISFLGIDFNVVAYHTIVWAIIISLLALGIIIYGMYHRANSVTRSTNNDLRALQHEYEDFKERARTRETKVKRELQTAVNTIEELKRGAKKS